MDNQETMSALYNKGWLSLIFSLIGRQMAHAVCLYGEGQYRESLSCLNELGTAIRGCPQYRPRKSPPLVDSSMLPSQELLIAQLPHNGATHSLATKSGSIQTCTDS